MLIKILLIIIVIELDAIAWNTKRKKLGTMDLNATFHKMANKITSTDL